MPANFKFFVVVVNFTELKIFKVGLKCQENLKKMKKKKKKDLMTQLMQANKRTSIDDLAIDQRRRLLFFFHLNSILFLN